VFDAVYTPRETRLLRDAAAAGCLVADGVAMFVGQAVEQLKLFTGETRQPQPSCGGGGQGGGRTRQRQPCCGVCGWVCEGGGTLCGRVRHHGGWLLGGRQYGYIWAGWAVEQLKLLTGKDSLSPSPLRLLSPVKLFTGKQYGRNDSPPPSPSEALHKYDSPAATQLQETGLHACVCVFGGGGLRVKVCAVTVASCFMAGAVALVVEHAIDQPMLLAGKPN
jgi:hypothetical protein